MLESSHHSILITVCLGSSCFARGNKQLIKSIDSFIIANNLQEKVLVKGSHCMEKCLSGPIIKIGDKTIEQVSISTINNILSQHLTPLLNE